MSKLYVLGRTEYTIHKSKTGWSVQVYEPFVEKEEFRFRSEVDALNFIIREAEERL